MSGTRVLALGVAGGLLGAVLVAGQAAAATIPPTATGDSRVVTEPHVPTTVCQTLTSGLTMANRRSGAPQEATPPDTARLQGALNACTQTGTTPVAVELVASGTHAAFLIAPVTIPKGVVLLVDSGVTLYGSGNGADYQLAGKPTCGTVATSSGGCKPLITVSGANAGIEGVRSTTGAQGRIDGRGDLVLNGGTMSWWQLATLAQTENEQQNAPRLIQANNSNNFTLYDIDLVNSPNFHVSYQNGNGFTAWGVRIKSPATARNTDGIDPSGATNVTIADSFVEAGDDGVAIKGGSAPSTNITVRDNHFYGTHGISIGSETNSGVSNVLVENNTLTGTDSEGHASVSSIGLRIKSSAASGGTVSTVSYLNTCVTLVKQPLVFDTHYDNGTGATIPFFTNILVNGVRSTSSATSGTNVLQGLDAGHPLGLTLENVSLDKTADTAEFANVGLFDSNLTPTGTGVTTGSVAGSGSVPTCVFPAYPAL
ncbi:MAG TPA: glycosyl hydrolase family 28 protein [Pseudonocardiaceae bacterium]|nr:glycosyl hydrolase family 28 protein [Pseudonocardiaceae bacterium]